MGKKYTGHCACGQVTYGFDKKPTFIGNCHCYGRELSHFGAHAFVNAQTVWIEAA
jgi:hypothetical protein